MVSVAMAHFALGFGLALAGIAATRAWLPRLERWIWGAGLAVAALVYVALAPHDGFSTALAVELAGLAIFLKLGWLGAVLSPWFLCAGWAGHAAWDLATPAFIDTAFIPSWYTVACIGFDLAVAGYFWLRIRGTSSDPAIARSRGEETWA